MIPIPPSNAFPRSRKAVNARVRQIHYVAALNRASCASIRLGVGGLIRADGRQQRQPARFRQQLRTGYGRLTLAVRLASTSLAQGGSVRQQVQTAVGDAQTAPMTTISQELDRSIARERLTSGIALFLAVMVVAIACVGIYALIAYDVARRQREFGVRLALRATAVRLVATVLGEGASIVGPALVIGLPLELATSRLLAAQLYGVDARDPWTLAVVALLLSIVAMGAAFRPARLASRVDPMALLRHE